ncbi:hypothetical protein IL306_014753 [Fusarium sp. DS 682]|nr:hypothetical protein IL306_014753 [Fusarium sp. DS 682]
MCDNETEQTPSVDLSQRHQVRQALFCYLKMVIDRLPEWSDFWKEQTEHIIPITPEILRLSLSDLEIYDKRLSRMDNYLRQSIDFYENFGDIFEEVEGVPHLADMDPAVRLSIMIDGSYILNTIKLTIKRSNEVHQRKIRQPLESIEDAIARGIGPSHQGLLLAIKEILVKVEEDTEACVKSMQAVVQRLERPFEATEDMAAESDLISSIAVPSMPMEIVDVCSDILNKVLLLAESTTH